MQPYVATIAEIVKNNSKEKPAVLRKLLQQWEADNLDNSELSDILIQPQLQAEMAGQLMVDVHESKVITMDRLDNVIICGPIDTLQNDPINKSKLESNDWKKNFYSEVLKHYKFYRNDTVLQLFAGIGNSVCASINNVSHLAIEIDPGNAKKYKTKWPDHELHVQDNTQLDNLRLQNRQIAVCDCDACSSPFDAFASFLNKYKPHKPVIVFLTWGYLGYSIKHSLNRKSAWTEMQKIVSKLVSSHNLKMVALGYSFPSGKNMSNHLIYGSFLVGNNVEQAKPIVSNIKEPFRLSRRLVLQAEKPAFLDLRWDEAIEAYNQMDIPRQREFRRVIEEYSGRSRKARELLLRALRERSLELINKALDEGTDLRAYVQDMTAFADDLGVSIGNPSYLQNVYRTNLQTAYSAGRWRAMTDPDVLEARPYWQYRATMDARTCDFCRAMDGKIFRKGNPETDHLVPPCHHQSRSQAVSYDPAAGEKVLDKPPAGFDRQQGYNPDFRQNPTELLRI